MDYKPFDMPVGVEAAIKRLASAAKRDGIYYVDATVSNGNVNTVYICETQDSVGDVTNEKCHFLSFIDGAWYEWTKGK